MAASIPMLCATFEGAATGRSARPLGTLGFLGGRARKHVGDVKFGRRIAPTTKVWRHTQNAPSMRHILDARLVLTILSTHSDKASTKIIVPHLQYPAYVYFTAVCKECYVKVYQTAVFSKRALFYT